MKRDDRSWVEQDKVREKTYHYIAHTPNLLWSKWHLLACWEVVVNKASCPGCYTYLTPPQIGRMNHILRIGNTGRRVGARGRRGGRVLGVG